MKILERHQARLNEEFFFNRIPIVPIDVTNVAEWYFSESEIDLVNLRDFPCVISPFRWVWMEYNIPKIWKIKVDNKWQLHRTQYPDETRCGVLILQDSLPENYVGSTPLESYLLSTFKEGLSDYKPPRFLQYTYYFISDRERLKTPMTCNTYVDEDGRILGTMAKWDDVVGNESGAQNFQRTWGYSVYFSISLMHCKNVRVDDSPMPEKVIKKRLKSGKPYVPFKTIYIDSIRKQSKESHSGQHVGGSVMRAIDILRGHFKDYTQGKGLFGKYHGRFWWNERASVISGREYKIRYSRS